LWSERPVPESRSWALFSKTFPSSRSNRKRSLFQHKKTPFEAARHIGPATAKQETHVCGIFPKRLLQAKEEAAGLAGISSTAPSLWPIAFFAESIPIDVRYVEKVSGHDTGDGA
jgi:hypothetical protein